MTQLFHGIAEAIARFVVILHDALAPIFGKNSGASWALAIVLLTFAMRLVLFPLFAKQIKTQRVMQTLQPKMKELQQKYKNDREKLNMEMMALYKEHGANPFTGCLPMLVQLPVFFALFRVLNSLKPIKGCRAPGPECFKSHYGISRDLVHSAAHAKVFGAPIAAAFDSKTSTLHLLSASATTVKVVTAIFVVGMVITTFITQRQLMARTADAGSPMASQQKVLLYVLPFTFFIFGYRFPLGVLIYWLTTNVWSMGQQAYVIRKMPPGAAAAAAARPGAPAPRPTPERPSTPQSTQSTTPTRRPPNRSRKRRGRGRRR